MNKTLTALATQLRLNPARVLHTAALSFLLFNAIMASPAMAATRVENFANTIVLVAKALVLVPFALAVAKMLSTERYSMAWGIGLCGALIGFFLFGGQAGFEWIKGIVEEMFG